MNRCVLLLELLTLFRFIIASTQNGEFQYRGNVSYSDVSLLILETGPNDVSLRYCAAECYKNVDCNAVEICALSVNTVCRLSKSITTDLITGKGTCSRYEIEHDCVDRFFFNRRTAKCQCAIDCDCGTVTPPSGGVVPKTVHVDGHVIHTNCINTGGHVWTMIQRRIDGSINFYRRWIEYKNGFGDVDSEFWIASDNFNMAGLMVGMKMKCGDNELCSKIKSPKKKCKTGAEQTRTSTKIRGLDNIRLLVQNGYTVLRVELEEGTESVFAEYSSFYIAGEDDKYRIQVSGNSGTAGDGISCSIQYCNNGARFSTYDNDNDAVSTNEALRWRGAWWYNDGHTSNLNGEYGNNNHGQGINWYSFKGWANSLSGARMMLRLG